MTSILKEILSTEPEDALKLDIGNRRSRVVSAILERGGIAVKTVRDLLSLSAGESSLLCLFASIIRDADLAGVRFNSTKDISGLVLIDEADLHLHLGFQHNVLPKLFALFPQVQFILSVHSPLVVLGMDSVFGSDGFVVLEMPSGKQINPEAYSEFLSAFEVFANTKKFEEQLLSLVNAQAKPALLVEGVTDSTLIQTAWAKLNGETPIPFEVIPCGIEPTVEARSGGAEMLRRCLEFLAIAADRPLVALFDNDRKGNEQFAGVNMKAFKVGLDSFHKEHRAKGAHAILLPVPPTREAWVTPQDVGQRYLSIEHYFSDDILKRHGLMGSGILGTSVFEIIGDKVAFANKTPAFGAEDFESFRILFSRIVSLL